MPEVAEPVPEVKPDPKPETGSRTSGRGRPTSAASRTGALFTRSSPSRRKWLNPSRSSPPEPEPVHEIKPLKVEAPKPKPVEPAKPFEARGPKVGARA